MSSQPPPDPYGPSSPPPGGYPPPGYSQQPPPPPGYGYGYPPPPPPSPGTNTMAILSLVFALIFSPLGIVFGHLAKKQIRESGEEGDGLATAGLVIGYIFTGIYVLSLLLCCASYLGLAALIGVAESSSSY